MCTGPVLTSKYVGCNVPGAAPVVPASAPGISAAPSWLGAWSAVPGSPDGFRVFEASDAALGRAL